MRTEDWTKDIEGMTSTCVVIIETEEVVKISEPLLDEFGFDKTYGHESVNPFTERFVWVFPVEYARQVLERAGWARAETPAAAEV